MVGKVIGLDDLIEWKISEYHNDSDEEVYYFFDEEGNYYHKVDFIPDYDKELEDGKGGFVIN